MTARARTQGKPTLKRDKRGKRRVLPLILGFIILPIFVIAYVINELHNSQPLDSAGLTLITPPLEQPPEPPSKNTSVKYQLLTPKEEADAGKEDQSGNSLPAAKSLLTTRPPFEDSQIIKLDDNLITSPNTVVTGYFRVASKYKPGKYDGWMQNMLSLHDAMVIFTQPELVDQIKEFRSHAKNRTIIIPLELENLPIGTLFSQEFWQDQLDRDPEKRIHRSYQLFWIWLSKTWFTTQAIRMNVYQSDLFVWSDIGCFRDKGYYKQTMVKHRENVPPNEMISMAHHKPNPPAEELFNDKYKFKHNFYHSGSQMAGYKDTWIRYHALFLDTIDRFLKRRMIIVEDQAVLQSTCLSHPEICAYAPFDQVKDNHYFGLRYVLSRGGEYNYWRHTAAIEAKKKN